MRALIFSDDWRQNAHGRVNPNWASSRAHIKLIEEQNYNLFVYRMVALNLEEARHGQARQIAYSLDEIQEAGLAIDERGWWAVFRQALPSISTD